MVLCFNILCIIITEYDMDVFYHPSNGTLNELVNRASPLFGKERNKEYETRRCGVEIYRKK